MSDDLTMPDDSGMDRILELKAKAKNRRDDGRYGQAMRFSTEALALAREGFDSARAGTARGRFATEIADVYGLMGGVERRLALQATDPSERSAHLHESIQMYDAGYEYERDGGGAPSSYNLVNRLLCRILEEPHVLDQLESELDSARAVVISQIADTRKGDPWALADLGILGLLTGTEQASSAYGPLHRLAPPMYVYDSALDTLRPLADVASNDRPELQRAVTALERRMIALGGSP